MKNKKGFTLIEVIIVAALTAIVGMGIISVLAQSNRLLNNSVRRAFIDFQTNLVLNDIARDIKEGYLLELPAVPSNTIKITQRVNGVDEVVTWSMKESETEEDTGKYCVRTDNDNNEKVYRIIGFNNEAIDKSLTAQFDYPTNYANIKPGKYYGVNVKLSSTYEIGSQIMTTDTQSSVFCRVEFNGVF